MQDVRDEDVMRRFLLGESGAEEQESVEERFMTDPAFFEALCALEDGLILAHLRGELPPAWRRAFDAHVLTSPARRRRVEESAQVHKALSSSRPQAARFTPGSQRTRWSTPIAMWMAAAAAVVIIVLSGWLITRHSPPAREATTAPDIARLPAAVATFVLAPGLTRSELGPSNVFRTGPGIQQVRLQFSDRIGTAGSVEASLRVVGGEPVPVPTTPEFRHDGDRVDVTWIVDAQWLSPGDYLLTLSGETAAGQRERLASRFFSIVQ